MLYKSYNAISKFEFIRAFLNFIIKMIARPIFKNQKPNSRQMDCLGYYDLLMRIFLFCSLHHLFFSFFMNLFLFVLLLYFLHSFLVDLRKWFDFSYFLVKFLLVLFLITPIIIRRSRLLLLFVLFLFFLIMYINATIQNLY